jgi:hypothetical protein
MIYYTFSPPDRASRFDAEFSYALQGPALKIWDLNYGDESALSPCRSVTNDAEKVLRKVERDLGRSLAGCPIMYRDSDCVWGGMVWDGRRVRFFPLREPSQQAAFAKLMERQSA